MRQYATTSTPHRWCASAQVRRKVWESGSVKKVACIAVPRFITWYTAPAYCIRNGRDMAHARSKNIVTINQRLDPLTALHKHRRPDHDLPLYLFPRRLETSRHPFNDTRSIPSLALVPEIG